MKQLLLLLALGVVSACTTNHNKIREDGYDFRKARWGMTKSEVIDSEGREPDDTLSSELEYKKIVMGTDTTTVFYGFHKGKLSTAGYGMKGSDLPPDEFYRGYMKTDSLLEKEYGKMTSDKTKWKNKLYQESPEMWGYAIANNHVLFLHRWVKERTRITHAITGAQDNCMELVYYVSTIYPHDPKSSIEELEN